MDEFITWRDDWLFGVDHLDRQHRELANLLNRLVRECTCDETGKRSLSDERKRILKALLDEFYARTRQHFSDEEALMAGTGYPGFTAHAREHAMLLGEFKSTFRERLDQGCCNMNPQTLKALKAWFVVHVARSDREFAEYLGVRSTASQGSIAGAEHRQPGQR
ncbi:MAG: hemerythrin family protein [Thiogranum sp.]|nr:hemerythrin family protein [Thiogranum sp.]